MLWAITQVCRCHLSAAVTGHERSHDDVFTRVATNSFPRFCAAAFRHMRLRRLVAARALCAPQPLSVTANPFSVVVVSGFLLVGVITVRWQVRLINSDTVTVVSHSYLNTLLTPPEFISPHIQLEFISPYG